MKNVTLNPTKLPALGRMRSLPSSLFSSQLHDYERNICFEAICNRKFLFQLDFQWTASVTESCSPQPCFFPFFFCWKMKEKGRGGGKTQANKPHCPDYKYRQKKRPLRCGWCETPQLSWQRMFALQFSLRTFDVVYVCIFLHFERMNECIFLHFECMNFSTFWILKEWYKFDLFFSSPGNNSYCVIILDAINLKQQ